MNNIALASALFVEAWVGWFYLINGLSAVICPFRWVDNVIRFTDSDAKNNISGLISLGLGLAIVLSHNIWIASLAVLVTIIGWLLLLNGIILLFKPELMIDLVKEIDRSQLKRIIITKGIITVVVSILILLHVYGYAFGNIRF